MSSGEFLDAIRAASTDSVRWAFLACVELLGATRASLLLKEGEENILRAVAAIGIDQTTVQQISIQLGEGPAGLAAERNMTLYGEVDGAKYIVVPIVLSNRVVGVMNFTGRSVGEDFDDAHLALAKTMADHIAHLLSSASLQSFDRYSGLPDRRPFVGAVEREIERARRTNQPFTLALIHLPRLISSLGDQRMGELLRQIGQSLRASCRRYDAVGHVEPDTFAFLFPATQAITRETVGRLTGIVSEYVHPLNGTHPVEVGVVHYPADGITPHELMGRARRQFTDSERDEIASPHLLPRPEH